MHKNNTSQYIFYSVIAIIILRFLLTGMIPLLDKTESRYAEIARIMSETNEWVVLQIDYGIPFWAKPPLSTWLSAASFELFGVNEIAARLPYFLLSILLLIILGYLVKKAGRYFLLPAFILLTTPEYLLHAGVVSTDTALCFCIALIMISFWKSFQNENRSFWKYLFFIGLGLGLLTKGPLVFVLTAPPLFMWVVLQKIKFKVLISKLPWLFGIIIMTIIAVPWYWFAEQKSPGFFDYFIVGEHFNRFLVSGWEGDLYGSGHSQPRGMIWVFLLLFAFPWIQIVIYKLWKIRKVVLKDKWISFLVLWLLWTPLFFTMSTNILHTYTLPVMIPIALLMIHWWPDFEKKKPLLILGSIFPVLVFIASVTFVVSGKAFDKHLNTDKFLVENNTLSSSKSETPIYYWNNKTYSSQFYTDGRVKNISNAKALDSVSKIEGTFFMLVQNKRIKDIPCEFKDKMIRLDSTKKASIFLFKKTMIP